MTYKKKYKKRKVTVKSAFASVLKGFKRSATYKKKKGVTTVLYSKKGTGGAIVTRFKGGNVKIQKTTYASKPKMKMKSKTSYKKKSRKRSY